MRPMRSVTANAYVSFYAIRRMLNAQFTGPAPDVLCAIILRLLWRGHGRAAQADMAAELGVPRSTMSSALARLQRRDLITRYRALDDHRTNVVELTASGRSRAEVVGDATKEIESAALYALGENGRNGFNAMANVLAIILAAPDLVPD